jgi:multiple sugar transport system substrate-binding protein
MKKTSVFAKMAAMTLAVSSMALFGAGCSGSSGPVKISYWNSFTGSDGETLTALVNKFNEDNKGKYEIEMNIMSQDAYAQKLPTALATRTGPELMTVTPNDLITYSRQKYLWNIGDVFKKTGLDKNDLTQTALDFGTVDDNLYGLPLEVFATYLYWNKDLFKAAGLDPEKAPATLDELAVDAIKIAKPAKSLYGFAMPVKGAPQFYAGFIRGNGGAVVDAKGVKSVLDSPENIATYETIRKLAYEKKVSPVGASGVDMDNVMFSGKLGMYMNGPWLIPGLKSHNINFGVAAIPAGSKGASTILDGAIFAVAKTATGQKKEAAYAFLKYWNSTAVGKGWAQKVGFPPYLKSVIVDPEVKANPIITTLAQSMSSGIATTWLVGVKGGARIDSDVLFPLIEQLQNGAKADEAVRQASDSIDKILSGN